MLDGTTQIVNLAGLVCGLYAKAAVQESIGKTRAEAGFGIPKTKLLELLPAGMDNSIIELWTWRATSRSGSTTGSTTSSSTTQTMDEPGRE